MNLSKNIPILARSGGRKEDRTPDPQNANLVLSQLSYAPTYARWWVWAELNSRPLAYQASALTT